VTTSSVAAVACVALAVLVEAGRPGWAAGRVRSALPGRRTQAPAGPLLVPLPPEARTWAVRGAAVAVALLLLTGRPEIALPVTCGAAAIAVPVRRDAARQARAAAALQRDVPRAADLLAMCLDAGVSPADAVLLVCDVLGGPVGEELRPIGAALRSGVDPSVAWAGRVDAEPHRAAVARLGRAFARAAATGAPLAETVAAVAEEERERVRWRAEAAARRAGVRAVGPLALCFLPAFVLLGVVPVVAGVATQVLGDLA
jgi:Flp pilus assembly protein TadB